MYRVLYDLIIRLYIGLIRGVSYFHAKAALFISGRKLPWPVPEEKQSVWIHVSSLGEFEQARPVIEQLRKKTDLDITLTFFSPSGYEIRKNYDQADRVLYMPFDTRQNAKKFFDHYNFNLILFVKYDFWMGHLIEGIKRQIPIIFISVIFRSNQFYFKLGRPFYLPVFKSFNHFFVQNEETKSVLSDHGVVNVTVVGDTRMDRVLQIANQAQKIELFEQLDETRKLFVIGSAWKSDIEFLKPIFQSYGGDFLFVIAPHNISEQSISQLIAELPNYQRYSKYQSNQPCDYLIIDNMGMLASLYSYAYFTYVGGAFRGALHNTIEAAAHGKPVFFGYHENNIKFAEAKGLVGIGAGFECSTSNTIIEQINHMLSDEKYLKMVCDNARDYVKQNSGATDQIVNYLIEQLK